MSIGQAGQYNFPRCVKRGEFYAAQYSETKFCADAMSLVFLLNRTYSPYYKWIHRAVRDLPTLGRYTYESISSLLIDRDCLAKAKQIEAISHTLIQELRRQGLTDHQSDFLPDHGPVIQQGIQDKLLRERSVFVG